MPGAVSIRRAHRSIVTNLLACKPPGVLAVRALHDTPLSLSLCMQQQHRTAQFRLFRVYIVAMAVLALLLLAVGICRRPGRQQVARKQEGQWAAYSADQVLSLLGMVRFAVVTDPPNHPLSKIVQFTDLRPTS